MKHTKQQINCNSFVTIVTFILVNVAIGFVQLNAQSWQKANGPWYGTANEFTIGRTGGTTKIYSIVGTNIYRTTDGASNWTQTESVGGLPLFLTCQFNSDGVVLVALDEYIKRSTNSGTTWNNAYQNNIFHPKSLSSSIADPSYMFVGMEKESTHASMRRSTNGGASWQQIDYFYDTVQTDITALAPNQKDYHLVWAGGTEAGEPPPEMYSKFFLATVKSGYYGRFLCNSVCGY